MPFTESQKQACNRWKKRNPEKVKAYGKRHRENNKPSRNAYARTYNAKTGYARKWAAAERKNAPLRYLIKKARHRAKEAGVPFNITTTDLTMPLACPLLGIWLQSNHGGKRTTAYSPTIDRIVPNLGYVPGNVRVISHQANVMKNNATPEQLRLFALNILKELA